MNEITNALTAIKVQDESTYSKKNIPRKQRNSDKSSGKNERKEFNCHYCGKRGHIARNCFRRRDRSENNKDNEKSKRKSNNDDSANLEAFLVSRFDYCTRFLNSDVKNVWILNSGASKHISFRREWFVDLDESYREAISLGDDSVCKVMGRGTVLIKRLVNSEWLGKLENVLYVLSLHRNLFLSGVSTERGCILKFKINDVRVYREGKILVNGIKQNNKINRMIFKVTEQDEVNSASLRDIETWHRCLGHINCRSLLGMANQQLIKGITPSRFDEFFCESCQLGK